MSNQALMDPISELQSLTISFMRQLKVIIKDSIIDCPEVIEGDDTVMKAHMEKADQHVAELKESKEKFLSYVDTLEEFHKTEAEQLKEIEELSEKNRQITQELITTIHRYQSVQESLKNLIDNSLDNITP